jgi:hypothetical protein
MCKIQTRSTNATHDIRLYHKAVGGEKAYDHIYRKYFKSHYNGQPTKRFLKLLKQIDESEKLSADDLGRLYICWYPENNQLRRNFIGTTYLHRSHRKGNNHRSNGY